MAWQDILGQEDVRSTLVVAHNAVNQALLNTVLGLPPDFFRRLLQSNGATSVIDFQPNGDGPPTCTIDRINQVTMSHSRPLDEARHFATCSKLITVGQHRS